jgi:hypothetical protein
MAHSAVGGKKRKWKNKDVRMTGCTKFFVQLVMVTGKNCSENTKEKMPKMLKGCSPKKTSGHK